jgi:hypothetical protein
MVEKQGKDRRDDIAKLERLIAFALDKADERLTNVLLLPPMLDYLLWSAMIRGRLAARVLVEHDGENVTFDFLPLDPRHILYELGKDGFRWIAYRTYRSASAIMDEYGKEVGNKESNEVIDYWRCDRPKEYTNLRMCKGDLLMEPVSYELPSMPILYLLVPSVPPIADSSGKVINNGDSIYAGAREIYKFEDDLISMWASHAKLLKEQPIINYYDDEGKQLTTTTFHAEDIINVPMGHNKLEASPVKEISNTLVNLLGMIGSLRQRVTLPDIEFGELRNFPLSGTAINELKESRDKVFGPIVRALNIFYTNIAYQIEQQMLAKKMVATVETEKDKKYYAVKVGPVDLQEAHIVRVEFISQTPWEQMDTAALADMLKRQGFPDLWIWENIYKVQDPKGMEDQVAVEVAEHSPTLMRLKAIAQFLKQERRDEAMVLIQELHNEYLQQQGEVREQPQLEEAPVQ